MTSLEIGAVVLATVTGGVGVGATGRIATGSPLVTGDFMASGVVPRREGTDNEPVLRPANLAARAVVLALTGMVTFTAGEPGRAGLAAQVLAMAVAAVLLAWRVLAELRARVWVWYARLLPYALAGVILTSGIASATRTGGMFNLLGASATLWAGTSTNRAAGYALTGLGIAATEATAAAVGAGAMVMIQYPLGLVLGLVLGRNLRVSRARAEHSGVLLAQAGQLRAEQAQVAALDERARIAREIHDVLAHSLGALGLQIQVARAILTERHDEEKADGILRQAQRMADDGLTETRRAIQALRGQTLPLPEELAELSAEHELRHGAAVNFTVSGEPRPLPADAQVAITRTAQEALVNAAKHAPGQPVGIRLDYRAGTTALTVRNQLADNGPAGQGARFATANGGYGLAGMRERLLLLDGTLAAGPDGGEWAVIATVPR
jgi:signal transduction histidine kinase